MLYNMKGNDDNLRIKMNRAENRAKNRVEIDLLCYICQLY